MKQRVLIFGGRHYNPETVVTVMDFLVRYGFIILDDIECLINGGADGADKGGVLWANKHNIPIELYEADWNKYKKAAGPIRNQKMYKEGKPTVAVQFPGGRGTRHMRAVLDYHNVYVFEAKVVQNETDSEDNRNQGS